MKCFYTFIFTITAAVCFAQSGAFFNEIPLPEKELSELKTLFHRSNKAELRDECANILDSLVTLTYVDDIPSYQYRTIYLHDEEGKVIQETNENPFNPQETFQLARQRNVEYFPGSSQEQVQNVNYDTGELVPFQLTESQLTEDWLTLLSVTETYNDILQTYELSNRTTYTRNSDGLATKIQRETWQDGEFVLTSYTDYFYSEIDGAYYIDSLKADRLNNITNQWEPSIYIYSERDEENRVIKSSIFLPDFSTSEFGLAATDSIVYTPTSESYIVYSFNDNFEINGEFPFVLNRINFKTVENGLNVSDSIYFRNTALEDSFDLTNIVTSEYDEEERLIYREFFNIDAVSEAAILTQSDAYYYQACISSVSELSKATGDCRLANPFSTVGDSGVCDFSTSEATLYLHDILGRQITEQKIQAGTSFNLPEVNQPGLYLLSLQNKNTLLWQDKVIISNE